MRTDDLIVQLAQAAGPVEVLAGPSMRLARWTAGAASIVALGVIVIGPRVDIAAAIRQPAFVSTWIATLLMALLSAASAFVLSVPGAERSPLQRALPLAAASVWAVVLIRLLVAGGDAVQRVPAFPMHWACVIEIAGFGLVSGWILLGMLRRAAPLQPTWSAALATLAAVGVAAVGTQIICNIDDPAHQIVAHLLPVALFVVCGTLVGRRSLDWGHRRWMAG